jgi:hypothetical protein
MLNKKIKAYNSSMKHLHERMDDLFTNGTPWQHRTLRTLFDPASAEWNMTSMEEKVDILKKIQASGERLGKLATEYQNYYRHEHNRPDIADDFKSGLVKITEYLLDTKNKRIVSL